MSPPLVPWGGLQGQDRLWGHVQGTQKAVGTQRGALGGGTGAVGTHSRDTGVRTEARETPGLWGHTRGGPQGCAPASWGCAHPAAHWGPQLRHGTALCDPGWGAEDKGGQSPRGQRVSPLPSAITERRMCREGQHLPTRSAAAPGSSPTAQPRSRPSPLRACPSASAPLSADNPAGSRGALLPPIAVCMYQGCYFTGTLDSIKN